MVGKGLNHLPVVSLLKCILNMRLRFGTMHAAFEVLFSGFVQLQCMVVACGQ